MTWSALANGSKGVFWFLYQSERVGAAMMDGLVDRQFNARPLWDEVGKLTREIAPLTPTLAGLRDPEEVKHDDPLLMVRRLSDSQGGNYMIAVNLDATNARRVKVDGRDVDLEAGGGRLIEPGPTP